MKGHLQHCTECGYTTPQYNSCGNRHCPTCQSLAQARWIASRTKKVLPVKHFQVVFTLPAELRPLALRNKELVYDLLLRCASKTLETLAKDRHGVRLGVSSVLHTWTRELRYHPHVHNLVSAGGLSSDEQRWVPTGKDYLLPVPQLRALFRSLMLRGLKHAYESGELNLEGRLSDLSGAVAFEQFIKRLWNKTWVVHVERPFSRAEHVLKYLGRYIYRIAISDQRLISVGEDSVCFITKDGKRTTISAQEFIRRYLMHVLPDRFHKIRHSGLYSPHDARRRLEKARELVPDAQGSDSPDDVDSILNAKTWQEVYAILTGQPALTCPVCGHSGMMHLQMREDAPSLPIAPTLEDTS
jgi:Putative transposase/Transposase zinc-binding domain